MKYLYILKPRCDFSKHEWLRSLLINFILAITTMFVLSQWFAENILFLALQDSVMFWGSDSVSEINGKPIDRMALIHIDETTHREWGSPLLTPRDHLKQLIEQAVKQGAKTIAVDIDLAWSADGCIHGGEKIACPITDKQSEETLGLYLKNLNENKEPNTPIVILTRLYRYPLKNNQLDSSNFLERAPSFLDQWLQEEKNVFWASTFFVPSEDRVLRHWRLAPLICENNHLNIVPSAALLAALAQLSDNPQFVLQDMKRKWNTWAEQHSCDSSQGNDLKQLCQKVDCNDLKVTLPAHEHWREKASEIYLQTAKIKEKIIYRFAPLDKIKDQRISLIDTYSINNFLEQKPDLKDQLVFIGATHSLSGDRHPIPIHKKEVDGVYVLMNATDTLLRIGHLKELPKEGTIALIIFTVMITALVFTFYEVITAFLLATILSGAVLYLLGAFLLRSGYEMQIALPLLTLNFVHILWHYIENFKEFHHRVKGKQHHEH